MKILVPVKRVPDYETFPGLLPDGSDIQEDRAKWVLNPFDEIAIEEAVRIKERGDADEVVAISLGGGDTQAQLRYALALGADRGVLIRHDGVTDSALAARAIAAFFRQEPCGLILTGKQSVDSDAGQMPQILAAELALGLACFASKITVDGSSLLVCREIDGGMETVRVTMPCVISTDLRLNSPRYATLPNIMKAKKKPILEISLLDLGVTPELRVRTVRLSETPRRCGGRKVESVNDLLHILRLEGRIP